MFRPVNIKDELLKEKGRSENFLDQARNILAEDFYLEQKTKEKIKNPSKQYAVSESLEILQDENIFTIEEIRNICIKYRLRFLDSKLFKNEIPSDAIHKARALQKKYSIEIEKYKIIAPASLFKLEDKNADPLFFTQITEQHYYLIHKWGSDLSWYRKFVAYPFQCLKSFLITLFSLSLFLSVIIPNDLLVTNPVYYEYIIYYRTLFFSYCFIGLFFFIVYLGFTLHKNFTIVEWDCKYIS